MDAADRLARVEALVEMGRRADAEREARRLLADEPQSSDGHAMLALVLFLQDRRPEAAAEAAEAVRLDPSSHSAQTALALAGQDAAAARAAAAAMRLGPERSSSFAALAQSRLEDADPEGVLAAADQGLAIDPEDPLLHKYRAMALTLLGRLDEAERAARAALAQDPESPLSHEVLARTLGHQGRWPEAAEHLAAAVQLDPDDDDTRAELDQARRAADSPLWRLMAELPLWRDRWLMRLLLPLRAWLDEDDEP
jgi:tetratricopeptide (TPR) repeat protein